MQDDGTRRVFAVLGMRPEPGGYAVAKFSRSARPFEDWARELTEAGADWQMVAYGHTAHGFTNPAATGAIPGVVFNPVAADRSWTAFVNFLEELFG